MNFYVYIVEWNVLNEILIYENCEFLISFILDFDDVLAKLRKNALHIKFLDQKKIKTKNI